MRKKVFLRSFESELSFSFVSPNSYCEILFVLVLCIAEKLERFKQTLKQEEILSKNLSQKRVVPNESQAQAQPQSQAAASKAAKR